MKCSFSLKVKKKRLYASGVLVIGNIISGNISCGEIVTVRVNSKEYKAHVDAINNNYPNGNNVHSCSTGSNVGLYLSKVNHTKVKLGKTLVEKVETTEKDTIDAKRQYPDRKQKNISKKQKKVEKNIYEIDSSEISQSKRDNPKTSSESVDTSHLITISDTMPYGILANSKEQSHQFNSKEKEFVEDIKVCLKDGGRISPSEFFVLDKIRKSLSISEERAKLLIAFVCKSYSDKQDEIEYSDAVSMCLMDSNYISDTERFLLEKLRLSLNLSQQRAYEIEQNCKWLLIE